MSGNASEVIGVWILRSAALERTDTGERILPYGENPRGVLILHEGGRMAAIITPSDQSGDKPPPRRKLLAYSGRYRIEPPGPLRHRRRHRLDSKLGRNAARADLLASRRRAPHRERPGAGRVPRRRDGERNLDVGARGWRHPRPAAAPPSAAPRSALSSASGVVTGREQVCPWQSMAIGSGACGRSARGGPFGQRLRSRRSTVSDGSGARSATAASACASPIVERPVDDDRPAARERVGAHQDERARAEPLRRAGDRADEALGRLAPAGLVGQMPEADEDVSASSPTPDGVAPSWVWRGRAPGTSAASRAVR